MPRSSRYHLPAAGGLPATLRRSSPEAQQMFLRACEEAVQTYGEGDEAYRAAYAALKQKFEKRGDQWIPKTESAA